jgi:PAS domain S-box-containing protein
MYSNGIDGRRNILFMGDSSALLMSKQNKWKKHGYDIVSAESGSKAIRTLHQNRSSTDLIVADIDLFFEEGGREAATFILNNQDIPVLFVSKESESESSQSSKAPYGFIIRNPDEQTLTKSIEKALKLHQNYHHPEFRNDAGSDTKRTTDTPIDPDHYKMIFDSAHEGIFIMDANSGLILEVNKSAQQMLGEPKNELLQKEIWKTSVFEDAGYTQTWFQELKHKDHARFSDPEFQLACGEAHSVEMVSNCYPIEGRKAVQLNIRDMSQYQNTISLLNRQLHNKESMLHELQHRTKNSFSMITGLIQLRSLTTNDQQTQDILEELSMKVNSIAELHTLLYEQKSFEEVNLKTYCGSIIESMETITNGIEIDQKIGDIVVSDNYASTIGMVLVELLCNSMKYAFPDQNFKDEKIELKLVEKGSVN